MKRLASPTARKNRQLAYAIASQTDLQDKESFEASLQLLNVATSYLKMQRLNQR